MNSSISMVAPETRQAIGAGSRSAHANWGTVASETPYPASSDSRVISTMPASATRDAMSSRTAPHQLHSSGRWGNPSVSATTTPASTTIAETKIFTRVARVIGGPGMDQSSKSGVRQRCSGRTPFDCLVCPLQLKRALAVQRAPSHAAAVQGAPSQTVAVQRAPSQYALVQRAPSQ